MPNPNFLTDADIYNRIGGMPALTQLIDPRYEGAPDPAILGLAQQDACNKVIAAAGVQADLGGFSIPDFREKFPHLVTIAALLCIYNCWDYGSSGQACPPHVEKKKADAELELQQLSLRRLKHGAADFSPNPAQRVTQVDNNPNHTRATLEGYQRGFC